MKEVKLDRRDKYSVNDVDPEIRRPTTLCERGREASRGDSRQQYETPGRRKDPIIDLPTTAEAQRLSRVQDERVGDAVLLCWGGGVWRAQYYRSPFSYRSFYGEAPLSLVCLTVSTNSTLRYNVSCCYIPSRRILYTGDSCEIILYP